MPSISFSTMSSASRICMTVAVSVMSCVVAPQCAPFAEPVLAQLDELLHHRQHRIADPLGRLLELRHVDFVGRAMADDFVGGVLRDDAELGLRPRQRRLEVEIFLHAVLVRPHLAHAVVVKMSRNTAESRIVEGIRALLSGRTLAFPALRSTREAARVKRLRQDVFGPKWRESFADGRPAMNVMTKPQRASGSSRCIPSRRRRTPCLMRRRSISSAPAT